jgi:RNA polymerase-binding transcription factor
MDPAGPTPFRTSLEEHRANLRHEIATLGADPDSDETAFADDRGFADSAHSTAERSRLLSVVTALRENLRDVEHALAKIETGTYGRCERCGLPIAAERLEALPWAALCIDCKRRGGNA